MVVEQPFRTRRGAAGKSSPESPSESHVDDHRRALWTGPWLAYFRGYMQASAKTRPQEQAFQRQSIQFGHAGAAEDKRGEKHSQPLQSNAAAAVKCLYRRRNQSIHHARHGLIE
jgi:hypothetical protein